ncbi:MAG: hypothetical protein ACP5O6_01265 [Candidatus Baltobacteraceae bacterium]
MSRRDLGFTALETIVAAGLIAVVLATVGAGIVRESTSFSNAATADTLAAAAREEARIAADAVKYDGSVLSPSSVATTLPMPVGSPISAEISLSTQSLADGAVSVRVRAVGDTAAGQIVRDATLIVERRVPLPGSSVIAPTLVAAPFGAP